MTQFQPFELTDELEAGRSAPAILLVWNGEAYIAEGAPIMVHDFVGGHGQAGDRGYCILSPHSQLWEVFSGLFTQEYRPLV